MNNNESIFTSILGIAIGIIAMACYWVAIITDGQNEDWGYLAVDILFFPFGLVRGILIALGLIG